MRHLSVTTYASKENLATKTQEKRFQTPALKKRLSDLFDDDDRAFNVFIILGVVCALLS